MSALRWGAVDVTAMIGPTTPVIETLRGLLMGTPIGGSALTGALWCVGLSVLGILACTVLFQRASAAR